MAENINCDVLIIGAGLTGLSLAYLLKDLNLKVNIAEARNRIGGRIHTLKSNDHQIELGATWLGSKHIHLLALLKDLSIETFPQEIGHQAIYEAISTSPPYLAKLPQNPDPTLRIKGGSSIMTESLNKMIENDIAVNLNESINKITENSNYFIVKATNNIYKTKKIVSTLPPNLLANTIQFTPSLPDKLINVCNSTHTWMGESIKIALRFSKPFWRNENSSGTIFSNVGPIPEMYDHSNYEDNSYALMGFLNGNYHIKTKAQRQELVLNQLRKYYGNDVDSMLDYHECVWNQEGETYFPYNYPITPHQNNGHSIFQSSYFDNKLLLAGTETSDLFPGYMDGAVRSAQLANQWIRNSLENT